MGDEVTLRRASAPWSLGPTSPRLSACAPPSWGALLLSRRSPKNCRQAIFSMCGYCIAHTMGGLKAVMHRSDVACSRGEWQ